ncbi:HEAT repeat protein [Dictyocaulus viviparus]|uniref:HEAT repeat protein n=1 Tax=Dictyocaulus viviparus TaxID=29172 RepID=A0A0D8XEX8_DICVI|nr:HEAT repeat protein [Dictyocaulus viviparus]
MGKCGSSYVDTFPILMKWLKVAESQSRAEILMTLSSMVVGLGAGAASFYKDIFKAAKAHLADRVMFVRTAALHCLTALVPFYSPMFSTELEAVITLCTKGLDGSNYETRLAASRLLSVLLSTALQPPPISSTGKSTVNARVMVFRPLPLDDALHVLACSFLRGGVGGFLKGGTSQNTASPGGQKDIRAGIAMNCWTHEIVDYSVEPIVDRVLSVEMLASGQAITVATLELSNLVRQIGTAVTPLFVEASGIMEPVFACLLHPTLSARMATAWCLRCITMAVPGQLTPLIDRCLNR